MPLEIVRNDITKMRVDAIVNAANSRLLAGGGVCGAIFSAAGAGALAEECARIGYCPVGGAVATGGFDLPAKHIIHAVGPVWQGGEAGEEALLRSAYLNSLSLALRLGLESIAFPLISSGIFGYPKDKALSVAVSAIGSFLLEHDMAVFLVVFDRAAYKLSDRLFSSIKAFIDDNYAERTAQTPASERRAEVMRQLKESRRPDAHAAPLPVLSAPMTMSFFPEECTTSDTADVEGSGMPESMSPWSSLDEALAHRADSFSAVLLKTIDKKGRADVEVYKRANIDRKLFSKIRSNSAYRPSKNTALAFAVALELNIDETADLLRSAGFALSPASRLDLIVEYFIRSGNYDIFEINEALFAFDESMLGA